MAKDAGAAATSEGAAGTTGTTGTAASTTVETKTPEQLAADKVVADKAAADKTAADAAAKVVADKAAADAAEKARASQAPEKYTLAIPDADKPYVDQADVDYFEKLARENAWTNEEAQAALEESLGTIRQQADRYLAETKADKTYGGDKFEETQRLAQTVVDKIRPVGHGRRESFLRFMGRGGAGNNLEVVSFLADLGKAMGEDPTGHTKAAGGGGSQSKADKLYDNPTSKVSNE